MVLTIFFFLVDLSKYDFDLCLNKNRSYLGEGRLLLKNKKTLRQEFISFFIFPALARRSPEGA